MHAYVAQQNLEGTLGWHLSQEDFDRISSIDFQLRLVDGIRFLRPEGPYRCGAWSYTPTALHHWPELTLLVDFMIHCSDSALLNIHS